MTQFEMKGKMKTTQQILKYTNIHEKFPRTIGPTITIGRRWMTDTGHECEDEAVEYYRRHQRQNRGQMPPVPEWGHAPKLLSEMVMHIPN